MPELVFSLRDVKIADIPTFSEFSFQRSGVGTQFHDAPASCFTLEREYLCSQAGAWEQELFKNGMSAFSKSLISIIFETGSEKKLEYHRKHIVGLFLQRGEHHGCRF